MYVQEIDRPLYYLLMVIAALLAAHLFLWIITPPVPCLAEGAIVGPADPKLLQCNHEVITNWWIVRFAGATCFISAIQLWMFFQQLDSMRQSLRVTAVAARAAEQTASASVRTERAYFFVELPPPVARDAMSATVVFVARNHGKTPARLLEAVFLGWEYSRAAASGEVRQKAVLIDSVVVGADESLPLPPLQCQISPQQLSEKGENPAWFNLWGELRYRDVFEKTHKLVFVARCDVDTGHVRVIEQVDRPLEGP